MKILEFFKGEVRISSLEKIKKRTHVRHSSRDIRVMEGFRLSHSQASSLPR